jgi:hypothetical protein
VFLIEGISLRNAGISEVELFKDFLRTKVLSVEKFDVTANDEWRKWN